MWSAAWIVLAYTLATPAATLASALGSFVAFFVGRKLASTKVRTLSFVLLSIITAPILLSIADFPNRSPFLAGFFPSARVLVGMTDFFWWGLFAFFLVVLLQFLSSRYQIFVSLEVLTVALFMASPFAAHREGFINRPYFLIDPLWSRGYDPIAALHALGLVIAVALILLTIGRATKRSSLFDLAVLAVLALLFYAYAPQDKLKELVSDPPATSGLTGKPNEGDSEPKPMQPTPADGSAGGQEPLAGQSGSGENSENSDNQFPFESEQKSEPTPVAVAIFRDDYDSPDGYYYFRQTAFSQFNGFRLVKDTTGLADKDLFKRFPTRVETKQAPREKLGIASGKLETRIALISSHTEPFGLVTPLAMKPVANPNTEQFERAYEVSSFVYKGNYKEILRAKMVNSDWPPEVQNHYLGYPDKDERYKKLADQIISGIPEEFRAYPLARALAINLYLGEKGKYTLRKRSTAGSDDPTADFLFGDLTGYCVHFSHSSVYLLRAAGVPARVGAGYAVEGRDRRGSALLILSSRAHAWPEVWIEGLGWYPLDVAPQTYLDEPGTPPDFDLQAMLAEMAREDGEEFEQVEEVNLRDFVRELFGALFSFLPWVFGGMILLAYGLKLEARFGHFFESGDSKIHALYRSGLNKAYDAGFRRKRGQGRLSFAEESSDQLPSLSKLTTQHLHHTFGKTEASVSELDLAASHFDSLDGELARAVPLWKRALGALNPLSWYFTR